MHPLLADPWCEHENGVTMHIAAIVDGNGHAIPFGEPGTVIIYTLTGDRWKAGDTFAFEPGGHPGLASLKDAIQTLAAKLGDCRIMLLRDVRGFPRTMLIELGFTLWSVAGDPADQLDNVMQLTAQAAEAAAAAVAANRASASDMAVPAFLGGSCAGIYTIDISQVQGSGTGHNSKDILLPFLQSTPFTRLDIVCDHVPKWFPGELGAMKLNFSTTPLEDGRWLISVRSDARRNGHRSGCSSCG